MAFITFQSSLNILRENYLVTWHCFLCALKDSSMIPSIQTSNNYSKSDQTRGHRVAEKSLVQTSLPHVIIQFVALKYWKVTRCRSNSKHSLWVTNGPTLHPGKLIQPPVSVLSWETQQTAGSRFSGSFQLQLEIQPMNIRDTITDKNQVRLPPLHIPEFATAACESSIHGLNTKFHLETDMKWIQRCQWGENI